MNQKTKRAERDPVPLFGVKPYIGLYADKSAVIEETGELQYFDEASVVIRTAHRTVRIAGTSLRVVCLSGGALAVTGEIASVSFEA